MTAIAGVDPRTGLDLPPVAQQSGPSDVADVVGEAVAATGWLSATSREQRADLLDTLAAAIEESAHDLIATAMAETGFTEAKLTGELKRAAYQFRFFGNVIREGSYLEATIDSRGETPAGPQPELRRMLFPLGPVAVFGASNFPFAFSVLGGDTASALAAGNPVVVKAHSSHPATSALSHRVLQAALLGSSAPSGTLGIVYGQQAGVELVSHPDVKAAGFTGSLGGGQALMDAISRRDEPIPFYGELSSLNPVVVTPAAAAERAPVIGEGFAASVAIGAGQMCTKPGFLLAPIGPDGDALVQAAAAVMNANPEHVLLNRNIHRSYDEGTASLDVSAAVRTVVSGPSAGPGFTVHPALFEVDVNDLDATITEEIFGPVSVVVRYAPDAVLKAVERTLSVMPASLTVTIHTADDESAPVQDMVALATSKSGRLVFNGFPTGVSVSWAQTHGGPWPSTNSLHTSVGATAIRRFLRPVTFQDAPASVLPIELKDGYTDIPRRIDGELRVGK